jgi:hypothetical protein
MVSSIYLASLVCQALCEALNLYPGSVREGARYRAHEAHNLPGGLLLIPEPACLLLPLPLLFMGLFQPLLVLLS